MIQGIGVDIVEIDRIKEAIEARDRFKDRFFTQGEVEYCESHKSPWQSYAGRFAAKEAVVKALGTGFRGFGWQDIEIIKDGLGKPEIILHNKAQELADSLKITQIMVSISHSRDYAVAQVVAIKG